MLIFQAFWASREAKGECSHFVVYLNVEQGELKYQEAMSEDLLGNGQPGRHEHARPVHRMEAQDILPHNMHIGWPAAGLQLLRRWLQSLGKEPCREGTFTSMA